MPGEQNKAKENPYHPPGSNNDTTPEPRLNAIEKWIGFILLGTISIVAIVVTVLLVLTFVGYLLVGHATRTGSASSRKPTASLCAADICHIKSSASLRSFTNPL